MHVITFQTKIKDGIIEIPEIYRGQFEHVQVILRSVEPSSSSDMVEQFLWNPNKSMNFKPLLRYEIYASE